MPCFVLRDVSTGVVFVISQVSIRADLPGQAGIRAVIRLPSRDVRVSPVWWWRPMCITPTELAAITASAAGVSHWGDWWMLENGTRRGQSTVQREHRPGAPLPKPTTVHNAADTRAPQFRGDAIRCRIVVTMRVHRPYLGQAADVSMWWARGSGLLSSVGHCPSFFALATAGT